MIKAGVDNITASKREVSYRGSEKVSKKTSLTYYKSNMLAYVTS